MDSFLFLNFVGEHWETYASREVSLRSLFEPFYGLVIHWRRLELDSWKGILVRCETHYAESALLWFHRLFQPFSRLLTQCRECFSSSTSLGLSEMEKEWFQVLDRFMQTSSVGEFRVRLTLVRCFGDCSRALSEEYFRSSGILSSESTPYSRLEHICVNVYGFYKLFVAPVEEVRFQESSLPLSSTHIHTHIFSLPPFFMGGMLDIL